MNERGMFVCLFARCSHGRCRRRPWCLWTDLGVELYRRCCRHRNPVTPSHRFLCLTAIQSFEHFPEHRRLGGDGKAEGDRRSDVPGDDDDDGTPLFIIRTSALYVSIYAFILS